MEVTMYLAVSSISFEQENTDSASIPTELASITTESDSIPAESASIPAESASIPAEPASVLNESGKFLYFLTILFYSYFIAGVYLYFC